MSASLLLSATGAIKQGTVVNQEVGWIPSKNCYFSMMMWWNAKEIRAFTYWFDNFFLRVPPPEDETLKLFHLRYALKYCFHYAEKQI